MALCFQERGFAPQNNYGTGTEKFNYLIKRIKLLIKKAELSKELKTKSNNKN